MNKKLAFFLLSLISIFFLLNYIKRPFYQNLIKNNFQLGNIVQQNLIPKLTIRESLLKDEVINFKFKSKYNNLGIIEILFNNHSKINNDQLIFRIKQSDTNDWVYKAVYDTAVMDEGQFFPFGFPIINDSKGKIFIVQIQSIQS